MLIRTPPLGVASGPLVGTSLQAESLGLSLRQGLRGACHAETIPPRSFGPVQRFVCPLDQRGHVHFSRTRRSDPDACSDGDRSIAGHHRERLDFAPQVLSGLLGSEQRRAKKNDEELIAAIPASDIGASK